MMARSPSLNRYLILLLLWQCFQISMTQAALSPNPASTNHWAFHPISHPTPPSPQNNHWARTPIDRFIVSALESQKLSPAQPANPHQLLRRLHFTLTGLPPSPHEIDSFITEFSRYPQQAIASRIDQLMESPSYGERWGRWWLDVARYADSNGQDENKVMANAWRYRDWVIEAFQRNLPFDQFISEQIAGDLMPPGPGETEREAMDRLIATGFLVLGPKMLAEQDKPKLVMDIIDEQIDTIGRAFMGMTLGCARCHDHKFDPISAHDYYALAGIFKSTRTMEDLAFVSKFNERSVSTLNEIKAWNQYQQSLVDWTNRHQAAIQEAQKILQKSWIQRLPEHLVALKETPPHSNLDTNLLARLQSLQTRGSEGSNLLFQLQQLPQSAAARQSLLLALDRPLPPPDASGLALAPGKVGAGFRATGSNSLELKHSIDIDPPQFTAEVWFQTECFPSSGETRRWLLNKNGNEWVEGHYGLLLDGRKAVAYLNIGGTRETVYIAASTEPVLKPHRWHHLAMTYDGTTLSLHLDGQTCSQTPVHKIRVPGHTTLALGKRQDGYVHFQGRLDQARVYNRALNTNEIHQLFVSPETPPPSGVVAAWDFNTVTPEQQKLIASQFLREQMFGSEGPFAVTAQEFSSFLPESQTTIHTLRSERDRLTQSAPPSPAVAMAVEDSKVVDVPIHIRGSHLQLTSNAVPRGFIQVLNKQQPALRIPEKHSGRLQLAQWLTSPSNPLTARVAVNRVWQAHFGHGLVRTSENFGLRGEPPTHPELLDWLASEFIQSGWNLKALHRLMLTSAVYQQGSIPTSSISLTEKDPENKLLSYFPRQRLEAEMIRDSILFTTGRLDPKRGGSLFDWKNNEYVPADDISAISLRRTIYLPIVRDRVFDALTIFDFANPSVCTSRRIPTVVSHQALFFLNSPLVESSATALARQLTEKHPGNTAEQIRAAWISILNRPVSAFELERSLALIEQLRSIPVPQPAEAASPGKSPASGPADVSPLAGLIQALLASNDLIYRE